MKQTELSMVNALLESIEETTIQTIDLTNPDVQLALNIWDEVSVAVQSTGWWYNKETFQLVPDTRTGEVFFPDGVLGIDTASTNYVKRGRVLYDLENHTKIFPADTPDTALLIPCVMEWDLEEVPPVIYNMIIIQSKIKMISERLFDEGKISVKSREYELANAVALKINLKFSGPNRLSVNNAASMLQAQYQR